jgi:anthraniloyl-CoA monooxygenase
MALKTGPLRIAVLGGGPGGLYFAALAKQLDPRHEICVWERNAPDDTFGFGVVFSDETLGGIEHADPEIYDLMRASFASWADIDIHYRSRVITSGGHGFAAMSRHRLLDILQKRAAALGTEIRYRQEAPSPVELTGFDLIVAADGVNSVTRSRYERVFEPTLQAGACKFMWLGTPLVFEAFKFFVVETDFGVMQAHGYPYSDAMSTFVVEMHEDVWRRAGLDVDGGRVWTPGESDLASIARCEEVFAEALEGHGLVGNNSRWISFMTVRNRSWRHGGVVLLGDAAHTAHFTIGSGTKLAMEDALALAACLHEQPSVGAALEAYEAERRPVVESTQRSAQASMEWFENIAQYVGQEPEQFAFNLLTRSRRVTYSNLRLRDPDYVDDVDAWFVEQEHARGAMTEPGKPGPPMFLPFRLRELELPNRIIVSPMDMYSATDGLVGEFHLVHLGSKALGGAGLVMTEMVCVSAEGRITPGCAGLYAPEHVPAFKRVVDFVHRYSPARIGIQLGHAGRKGSTKLMWEGMDEPLDDGNWELVAPSPIPYMRTSQVPRAMTREDMDVVREQFVRATTMAAEAGFDLLELHCAHGYLLASFISPVTNRRRDEYGESLENRLRYPLEVFDAVRAVWPPERPITVRISATDWVDDGLTGAESVTVAQAFAEHGADAIDVSTGQTTPDEAPAFGRSYQTPFADRIRNRVRIPTIAVGAISTYDDVNSILLAGRADLCALARAHLYDPAWTLHAAAEQDVAMQWPVQFERGSRRPPTGRVDGPRPRLELHRADPDAARHQRWRAPSRADRGGGPRPGRQEGE